MSDAKGVSWKRISAEGIAIVVSILLAFSIDAWWDRHIERDSLVEFLASFEQELIASRADIERTLKLSVGVLKTTDEVFQVLSNDELKDPPESFVETIGSIYKIHNPVLVAEQNTEKLNRFRRPQDSRVLEPPLQLEGSVFGSNSTAGDCEKAL